MKKICLLIFCLILAQNFWAQRPKRPLSEADRKLREELQNDKDFVAVDCWRGRSANSEDGDISYKLKAIQVFRGEGGQIKLKKTCGTIEGDPIFSYLTVEKGKASVFIDTSQDDFGPQRVFSYQCDEFAYGQYFNDLKEGKMVFQTGEAASVKNGYTALRCVAGNEEVIF